MEVNHKTKELALVYRKFSSIKYNKYKAQFPRMRESELVYKIIKEWESLSKKEKFELKQCYEQEYELKDDDSESEERISPGSSYEEKKRKKQEEMTPCNKKSGVRVFVRSSSSSSSEKQSESEFDRNPKKDFEISDSESEKKCEKIKKTKKIMEGTLKTNRNFMHRRRSMSSSQEILEKISHEFMLQEKELTIQGIFTILKRHFPNYKEFDTLESTGYEMIDLELVHDANETIKERGEYIFNKKISLEKIEKREKIKEVELLESIRESETMINNDLVEEKKVVLEELQKKSEKRKRTLESINNELESEFPTFYSFYFKKLIKDHPSWSPNQITNIIKLLWLKKNSLLVKTSEQVTKKRRIKIAKKAPCGAKVVIISRHISKCEECLSLTMVENSDKICSCLKSQYQLRSRYINIENEKSERTDILNGFEGDDEGGAYPFEKCLCKIGELNERKSLVGKMGESIKKGQETKKKRKQENLEKLKKAREAKLEKSRQL